LAARRACRSRPGVFPGPAVRRPERPAAARNSKAASRRGPHGCRDSSSCRGGASDSACAKHGALGRAQLHRSPRGSRTVKTGTQRAHAPRAAILLTFGARPKAGVRADAPALRTPMMVVVPPPTAKLPPHSPTRLERPTCRANAIRCARSCATVHDGGARRRPSHAREALHAPRHSTRWISGSDTIPTRGQMRPSPSSPGVAALATSGASSCLTSIARFDDAMISWHRDVKRVLEQCVASPGPSRKHAAPLSGRRDTPGPAQRRSSVSGRA